MDDEPIRMALADPGPSDLIAVRALSTAPFAGAWNWPQVTPYTRLR